MPSDICWCSPASRWRRGVEARLKLERSDLLYIRNLPHLRQCLRRHVAIDFDQRNGVAALRVAPEMEGRDIDAGLGKEGSEPSDESWLVLIGHVQHRWREFGIHPNTLDIDDARSAVGKHRARYCARLTIGDHRQRNQAVVVALSLAPRLLDDDAAILGDDRRRDDVDLL